MKKRKIEWKYGEDGEQKYYEAKVGNDRLWVFMNNWLPDTWMGQYNSVSIYNKTKNDRQRIKQGLAKQCPIFELHKSSLLCSNDPEYMMRKVEWCYLHNLNEITP